MAPKITRDKELKIHPTADGKGIAAYESAFLDYGKRGITRCYTVSIGGVTAEEALRKMNKEAEKDITLAAKQQNVCSVACKPPSCPKCVLVG